MTHDLIIYIKDQDFDIRSMSNLLLKAVLCYIIDRCRLVNLLNEAMVGNGSFMYIFTEWKYCTLEHQGWEYLMMVWEYF